MREALSTRCQTGECSYFSEIIAKGKSPETQAILLEDCFRALVSRLEIDGRFLPSECAFAANLAKAEIQSVENVGDLIVRGDDYAA